VKRSVPAIAGARFVVSDNGDILSPKYAPEIIDPATIPELKPKAFPMPSSATPMVATVDHELPVASETKEQITTDATKNMLG
jgi:hypothetical protein